MWLIHSGSILESKGPGVLFWKNGKEMLKEFKVFGQKFGEKCNKILKYCEKGMVIAYDNYM